MSDKGNNNIEKEISFMQAIRNGDLNTVKTLFKSSMQTRFLETAFTDAVRSGHLDIAEFLLKHGAQVDTVADEGNTILVSACLEKNWEVVKVLLPHGADPLNRDYQDDRTCAWMVASDGQKDIVSQMIAKAPNETVLKIIQEVLLGSCFGGNLELIKYALNNGAEINCRGSQEETALIEASRAGNPEAIRLLLSLGADPQAQDESGDTALIWAARSGDEEAVRMLIKAGSDVNHRNRAITEQIISAGDKGSSTVRWERRFGFSVLECACKSSNTGVLKQLLDLGLDINEKGWEGRTPLMSVISPEMARFLLERGAQVDARDFSGWTALMLSSWLGDVEIMSVLISYGADVNVKDGSDDWTPLIAACYSDVISIKDFPLKENRASVNDHPTLRSTVELLLRNGADVNMADGAGLTPIEIASKYNCMDVVELLLENGAGTNISNGFEEKLRQAALKQNRPRIIELMDHMDPNSGCTY